MTADKHNPWRRLAREKKYDCRYFEVWQDTVHHTGGTPRPYHNIHMKCYGVAVVPVDASGQIILVGQYRYVLARYTWEVPGGGAFEPISPIDIARKELQEETGCKAKQWLQVITGSASPGSTDEMTPGFVAWDIEEGSPEPEEEESLSWRRVRFTDAVDMALNGEIANLAGVALILAIHAKLLRRSLPESLATLLSKS